MKRQCWGNARRKTSKTLEENGLVIDLTLFRIPRLGINYSIFLEKITAIFFCDIGWGLPLEESPVGLKSSSQNRKAAIRLCQSKRTWERKIQEILDCEAPDHNLLTRAYAPTIICYSWNTRNLLMKVFQRTSSFQMIQQKWK